MKMTLYAADCRGNPKNVLYPRKYIVEDEASCLEAIQYDHVCGAFRDFRRSNDAFISSDCDVMDCDNDHSDIPEDWVYPEDLDERLTDVSYIIIPSRNNMKTKDGKSARPRFHVYFPHELITDAAVCAALKAAIRRMFPAFDGKALDAARFIYGNITEEIIWHEGELMAAMLNNPLAQKILNEIMNYHVINMASVGNAPEFDEENTKKEALERYLKYLKIADPTLTDLKVDLESKMDKHILNEDDLDNKELVIKNIHVSIQSMHATYKDHKQIGEIELPFLKYESNGTIRMLRILPAIFEALDTGNTLFIDEIENGLHPNLVKILVGLFNSNETNPNNAQLICTTHDTLLLNDVRRDQVWFTDKNQYGETKICRLSSYSNVRSNDNVGAKYLQGVFGAVPDIPDLE